MSDIHSAKGERKVEPVLKTLTFKGAKQGKSFND